MKVKIVPIPSALINLPEKYKSVAGREEYAQKLSDALQEKLWEIPTRELTVEEFRNALYTTLAPHKPLVKIVPREQKGFTVAHLDLLTRANDTETCKIDECYGYEMG